MTTIKLHQDIFVHKTLPPCMSAHTTMNLGCCVPVSRVSAAHVEIIIACVETIQFQYLSVCLCYKFAAAISSVWNIHLS